MFEIKDGQVSLNKTRKLTPKQLVTLKNCISDAERNRYLMSLLGLTKGRMFVNRVKTLGIDNLATKRPNSLARLMDGLKQLNRDHSPTEKHQGQWIGVEIECIIPHQGEANSCGDCDNCNDGDSCENVDWSEGDAHDFIKQKLKAAGVSRCCVKYDGSLNDDEGHGVEITVLFNSAYGFEPLERVCKVLSEARCYVNKTCGLHVHLDSRHLTKVKVLKIGKSLGHALPVLKYLVSESRRTNSYCQLDVSHLRGDRYYAINLTAFAKYRTIEVRLHQGSLNATKIKNWIEVLKLVASAKLTQDLVTFQDLIDVGLSDELIEYCDKRISELNPDAWIKLMPGEVSQWPRRESQVIISSPPNPRLDAFERDERVGA